MKSLKNILNLARKKINLKKFKSVVVLVRVSIDVMKQHDQKQLGGAKCLFGS